MSTRTEDDTQKEGTNHLGDLGPQAKEVVPYPRKVMWDDCPQHAKKLSQEDVDQAIERLMAVQGQ